MSKLLKLDYILNKNLYRLSSTTDGGKTWDIVAETFVQYLGEEAYYIHANFLYLLRRHIFEGFTLIQPHEDYCINEYLPGEYMDKSLFENEMKKMIPDLSQAVLDTYITYAYELEEGGAEQTGIYFANTYTAFKKVQEHFGSELLAKIFHFDEKFTFDPHEIEGAAKALQAGIDLETIKQMAVDGKFDK